MDYYNSVFTKYIPNGECSIGTNDKHEQYSLECYDNSANYGCAMLSREELKEMADAIYAELGLGWLPYPENKPEERKWFLGTIEDQPGSFLVVMLKSFYGDYQEPSGDIVPNGQLIAFMVLPAPYQPA